MTPYRALHHVELWTSDLDAAEAGWHWLLTTLGWSPGETWPGGRTWRHEDGTYLVLEQSVEVAGPHDRRRAGLNHLALTCATREHLDALRRDAPGRGWRELFADDYPHAGGSDHTALYVENAEGFEVEVVSPVRTASPR